MIFHEYGMGNATVRSSVVDRRVAGHDVTHTHIILKRAKFYAHVD